MNTLRIAVVLLASLACVASAAVVARAEAPLPTAIVSIPVGFYYTHDANDPSVKNKTPTGIQAEFITPYYLGVGVAQYKSGILKKSWNVLNDDLDMTYKFLELSANIKFGPVLLAWGYGGGSVAYSPEENPTGVKWKESQAFERFVRLGLLVSPAWSIHVASHALVAEAEQEIFGTKRTGSIGAILTTAGVGYSF
jgi:hypothetical protein